MFAEICCVEMDPLERRILKQPFGSWHLICSLLPRRWQAVHRRSSTRLLHDPNPPTYCSNRVPRQTKSCFILFINREEGGPGQARGGGREWGVLWRRNAIHIMSGTLTFQRSRNACKPQTRRQNVNSWYLATNANKFWNQSWKMWNKKSNP